MVDLFAAYPGVQASFKRVSGPKGRTDFVRIDIPRPAKAGRQRADAGDHWPSRRHRCAPTRIGMVSDADGAVAVSSALKLAQMQTKGDVLAGDDRDHHICPDAPTRPHEPVDFMDSPATTSP